MIPFSRTLTAAFVTASVAVAAPAPAEVRAEQSRIEEALEQVASGDDQAPQLAAAIMASSSIAGLPEGLKVRAEEALNRYLLTLPVGQEAENVAGYSALSKLRPENPGYSRKRDTFATMQEERRRTVLTRFMTAVDDFTETTFYTHRSQPAHNVRPFVSMYLSEEKAGPVGLRFVLNYASSHGWLFVRGAEANIDGDIITIPATSWKRGNNTKIWEWSDEPASAEDVAIAKRIVNSRQTVIRFNGSEFSDNYIVSGADKEVIRDAFVAFEALGGTLP